VSPMLIDHPSLKPLARHMQAYTTKGLRELQAGGSKFAASESEIYAAAVYERVGELDNCLDSMRIAISEIVSLAKSPTPTSKPYRYHFENYLLRTTGLLDRAFRLVGITLGMPKSQIDNLQGNTRVRNVVKDSYPEIHRELLDFQVLMVERKDARNDVAHSTAFSSRELGLFTAVEHLKYEGVDQAEVESLMSRYFSTEASLLGLLTIQAEARLFQLIGQLESVILSHVNADA